MRETPLKPLLFGPGGYGKIAALQWTPTFRETVSLKQSYIQFRVFIDDFLFKWPDMGTLAPGITFLFVKALLAAQQSIQKFTLSSSPSTYAFLLNLFAQML